MGVRDFAGRVTLLGLAPVAALITLVAVFFEHVTVKRQEDLGRVTFGFPLDWLVQDQSTRSPPFPWEASVASPWEHPTHVAFVPLVADLLFAYAVLLAAVFFGWLVFRSVIGVVRRSQ